MRSILNLTLFLLSGVGDVKSLIRYEKTPTSLK